MFLLSLVLGVSGAFDEPEIPLNISSVSMDENLYADKQEITAENVYDLINSVVDEVTEQNTAELSPETEKIREIVDNYVFYEYYYSDEPNVYSGKSVVESSANGRFDHGISEDDMMLFTIRLLSEQAHRVLLEYPESQFIIVSISEERDSTIPYAFADFYNVNGNLVISQETASYNPSINMMQMVDFMIYDKDNPKIPNNLIIE